MDEGNKSDASDTEIVGYLVQSGFTEDEIKHAMKETGSRDIELLVNFIININQNNKVHRGVKQVKAESRTNGFDEAIELSKKRRDEVKKERLYKEQLISQIRADMVEKLETERLEDERLLNSNVQKTEDLSDCRIKLWLGNGTASILGFSKDDTIEDLFVRIETEFNKKGFNLFRMNQVAPIERSTKKLSDSPGLYPRGVLFVEE